VVTGEFLELLGVHKRKCRKKAEFLFFILTSKFRAGILKSFDVLQKCQMSIFFSGETKNAEMLIFQQSHRN
jgi:hypothetical protein